MYACYERGVGASQTHDSRNDRRVDVAYDGRQSDAAIGVWQSWILFVPWCLSFCLSKTVPVNEACHDRAFMVSET